MKRFALDAAQTDAILELKLYRLARLEILVIQNELKEKRSRTRADQRAARPTTPPAGGWCARSSKQVQKTYGDARRTAIEQADETEYAADAFIVDEDNVVIVSRDGWVKRQKEVKDLSTTRLREGDAVLAAMAGSTRVHGGVLHQLRRGLHGAHHRRAGLDRLRRAGAAAVQVQGQRARGGGVQPRPARHRRHRPRQRRRRRRAGDASPTPTCRCRPCTPWR